MKLNIITTITWLAMYFVTTTASKKGRKSSKSRIEKCSRMLYYNPKKCQITVFILQAFQFWGTNFVYLIPVLISTILIFSTV